MSCRLWDGIGRWLFPLRWSSDAIFCCRYVFDALSFLFWCWYVYAFWIDRAKSLVDDLFILRQNSLFTLWIFWTFLLSMMTDTIIRVHWHSWFFCSYSLELQLGLSLYTRSFTFTQSSCFVSTHFWVLVFTSALPFLHSLKSEFFFTHSSLLRLLLLVRSRVPTPLQLRVALLYSAIAKISLPVVQDHFMVSSFNHLRGSPYIYREYIW